MAIQLPDRHITRAYILALGLIACFAVLSHITLERVIEARTGSAAIVNSSGRQRMLAERMAFSASLWMLRGDADARDDLEETIGVMATSHARLSGRESDSPLDIVPSAELKQIYFSDFTHVDAEVMRYIALARTIATGERDAPATQAAFDALQAEARGPIVVALDLVVAEYEHQSEHQIRRLEGAQRYVLGGLLITLLLEAILIFRPLAHRVQRYARELLRLASTDPLTGALNRRSFDARCSAELDRERRYRRSLAFLMLDIDHFKHVNDTYGHAVGDEVLRKIVMTVNGTLRTSDFLARLGGEEFAIVLPETPLESAALLADRLRRSLGEITIDAHGKTVSFTVSIGVTSLEPGDSDIQATLDRADQALYRAKNTGRDRVIVASGMGPDAAFRAPTTNLSPA